MPTPSRIRTSKRRAVMPALALVLACHLACVPRSEPPPDDSAPNPLYVNPADYDFGANPKLLAKLTAEPHRYLRFVNVPFSQEVCRRFSAEVAAAPAVNLHGDAHVEQYAVTASGRGLTDYDDSSTGPAVLDLVRFGVSTRLACEQQGCSEQWATIFGELLRGYRAAIKDPGVEVAEPALARREREKFEPDHAGFFAFVDSVMEPMPEDEAEGLVKSLEPYFNAMREEHSGLGDGFFAVEKLGHLRAGVGSALDLKYLVRLHGKSDEPSDDVVLEVKQVRDLHSVGCITVDPRADPLRVLRGHLRIANQPYRFLGYSRFRGFNFWVHAWEENYAELEIDEAFSSPEEVAEVAFDVGVQLGRGHTRNIAPQLENQLRAEQLEFLDRSAAKIEETCRELARLAAEAWQQFKAAAQSASE